MNRANLARLLALCALALPFITLGQAASAHGGGEPQLTNEPTGPYLISAWTNPTPATVGTLHVTVALSHPDTGEPITGADVRIRATMPEDDITIEDRATHENAAIPLFYEADMELTRGGQWQIDVQVSGNEGEGAASFTLDIAKSGPNWLLIVIVGGVAALVLWAIWLLVRRKPQSSATTDASNKP